MKYMQGRCIRCQGQQRKENKMYLTLGILVICIMAITWILLLPLFPAIGGYYLMLKKRLADENIKEKEKETNNE